MKIATFTVRMIVEDSIEGCIHARQRLAALQGVKSVVHEEHMTEAENKKDPTCVLCEFGEEPGHEH